MQLGYYIHLHGSGHAQRARAIAQYFNFPVTFIGTGVSQYNWQGVTNYQLLELPPDRIEQVPDLAINQNCQTYSFHYAPYYADTYRQRIVKLAQWVDKTNPTAVIVDVSSEITQCLRLLGVPVIAVRQHGDRSDFPHLCGYSAAYKLFAPYPEILEFSDVPNWVKAKTIYTPGFSRYSEQLLSSENSLNIDRLTARKNLNITPEQKVVVVLNGKGGNKHSLAQIASAAVATPDWLWLIVGETRRDRSNLPNNVSSLGWRENTYIYLKAADVAIASGGHNTVMEIGTAKIPFLCIPEKRPFDEQKVKAELLEQLGLCFLAEAFPEPVSIEFTLAKLQKLDVSKWDLIMAVDGASHAASLLEREITNLVEIHTSNSTLNHHYLKLLTSEGF